MNISEKGKDLINKARAIHYTRWYEIDYLIEQAESEEIKRILKNIQLHKYHLEESSDGYE